MITRLLLAAIAAGLIAGALISVLQVIKVTPLIHAAEVYEMPYWRYDDAHPSSWRECRRRAPS